MTRQATKECPECGKAIPERAGSCPCGWGVKKLPSKAFHDPERFRCAWVASGVRCRYPGTSSHSTMGEGPWFCSGHYRAGGHVGQIIVEESEQITLRSYTSEAMVDASRKAFLERPIPPAGPLAEGCHWPATRNSPFDRVAKVVDRHRPRQPGEDDE